MKGHHKAVMPFFQTRSKGTRLGAYALLGAQDVNVQQAFGGIKMAAARWQCQPRLAPPISLVFFRFKDSDFCPNVHTGRPHRLI